MKVTLQQMIKNSISRSSTVKNAMGCVLLRPVDQDRIKLRQMAVSETCQGQGMGARLVGYAEENRAYTRLPGYGNACKDDRSGVL